MTTIANEATGVELKAVIDGVAEAWADNNPDRFADSYTADATMVLSGDRFFRGREVIRQVAVQQFKTAHKGTTLLQNIVDTKIISDDAAVVITEGGVLAPGQSVPSPERALRATWVFAKQDGKWLVSAYQNGRLADTPLPGE
ncbi:SgcJ/EcaC family oxidoreductase [Saccharothrix sp.]|uniref:SgcJ/EcaC family oxidoreductase n=1 Tax=Saccharothrix sp. TaxID=1873460 RepID=UPI002811C0D3|nr:SgcJ/EcaC family oxidoreductase [Saccharothrix sp.]